MINKSLHVYVYSGTIFIAVVVNLYSMLKPGITTPEYPVSKMRNAINQIGSASLISTSQEKMTDDSSDRRHSPLFRYKYTDGSQILATVVRVKKRDDFKIETYGLLTKNLSPIYIQNQQFSGSPPYSIFGILGDHQSIQTCIYPGTDNLSKADIRLNELTGTAVALTPNQKVSIISKIIGSHKAVDYSCLVLTYKSANESVMKKQHKWREIVGNVQSSLAQ